MEKIIRTARVLSILIRIVRGIACAVFGIAVAAAIAVQFFSVEGLAASANVFPELLPASGEDSSHFSRLLTFTLAETAIEAAFVWIWLGIFGKMLAPMTEGRPFDGRVSSSIRSLAFIQLGVGIFQGITAWISQTLLFNNLNRTALSMRDILLNVYRKSDFDLSFLWGAAAMLLISCIFRYGEELQRRDDETL